MPIKRLLIVGGVAGGASCAARARRLSESTEIIMFERGPFVSFANCGLPYYVGRVIPREEDLLVASPELFRERFRIDVRINTTVTAVDCDLRQVEVEERDTGRIYRETYDALVLAPGSAPVKPKLQGIDLPGIFTLWTIPDTRRIVQWIEDHRVKTAAVIGGGFIGLEMTENLQQLGIETTIVEMSEQLMPALDPEMATYLQAHLRARDVRLRLGTAVTGFTPGAKRHIRVALSDGTALEVDLVVVAVGVRPRTELAQAAGIQIGESGGIRVNDRMQTSVDAVWAVGDAVEVREYLSGVPMLVPLAGPANRQGRIAADAILGRSSELHRFRGVQATAVCGIMGMTVAATGITEKFLQRLKDPSTVGPLEKIYLHPDHHVTYYPDAQTITMKLIFSLPEGRVLGAQALGLEGVEKRIDVISMAIQRRATVYDLEEAELCYAPQYGSAKDPVNMAGMIAANVLRGYSGVEHWQHLDASAPYILDVRDPAEYEDSHIPSAVNIPLNQLRERLSELPRDREIWTHCFVGQRSYYAERILRQNGFRVKNLSGGYSLYQNMTNGPDSRPD